MFTNWLTGTTTNAALNNIGNSENIATVITTPSTNGGIMSTPPDVVLEVGPAPSIRFVAHSIVLGMHSGYLRSAIRLDENAAAIAGHSAGDLVLYLGNVTAEQFAPLLTYMYTGYLDLNVENIFGVLLATHVLHMPRALEICRSFLARAQTEGYLANGLATSLPPSSTAIATSKIIRPIPSKATLPNFGFMPTPAGPMPHQLPLPTAASVATNSFKSLQQMYIGNTPMIVDEARPQQPAEQREEIVDVDRNSTKTEEGSVICDDDDDEDEEVFIDSNTDTDNEVETEIDCTTSVSSRTSTLMKASKPQSIETAIIEREIVLTAKEKSKAEKREQQQQKERSSRSSKSSTQKREKNEKRKSSGRHHHSKSTASGGAVATASVSGLQVAKAPIPASQLDASEGTKFIIDVASCDGPVRFRRILNTAYGHKPEDFAAVPERTQQSVSLSFHQQMAKTISQQRQQLAHAEESENSESSGGGGGGAGGGGSSGKHSSKTSNEIYVCVYCKHTFKSQYCYQKHAKRHLNPLSLNCTSTSGAAAVAAEVSACEKLTAEGGAAHKGAYNANGFLRGAHTLPLPIVTSKQNVSELLRREVRPLDMNVQYYPCKTCGSKFPSYYFVHKHRKMCHADEEAAESTAGGGGGTVSASGAATTESGLNNSEEATSSAGGTVKKLD